MKIVEESRNLYAIKLAIPDFKKAVEKLESYKPTTDANLYNEKLESIKNNCMILESQIQKAEQKIQEQNNNE